MPRTWSQGSAGDLNLGLLYTVDLAGRLARGGDLSGYDRAGRPYAERVRPRTRRNRLRSDSSVSARSRDGEPLRYATWLGVGTWGNEDAKIAVRQRLWVGLRDAATSDPGAVNSANHH
jgi:hypothetical protein